MLQALRDGRDADPGIARIDDPQEKKAFNRYIALLYCANVGLAPRCHGLSIVSDELERAAERVRLLEQAAEVLEEGHGLTRPRRVRDWRKTRNNMEVNEFCAAWPARCAPTCSPTSPCAGRSYVRLNLSGTRSPTRSRAKNLLLPRLEPGRRGGDAP